MIFRVECRNLSNIDFIKEGVDKVAKRVNLDRIRVYEIILTTHIYGRGSYHQSGRTVYLNPLSKSFWPNYKGYAYKKFGGRRDLTPGGVFAHECGHALAFNRPSVLRLFRKIREISRKGITSYGTGSVAEDVAESFRLYVTNPELLKDLDLARYKAINRYARDFMLQKL